MTEYIEEKVCLLKIKYFYTYHPTCTLELLSFRG